MEIFGAPEGKKCEEFFYGQNGVEISAEISAGAEYSTKNLFFAEISAPVEISAEISTPFWPEKNSAHFFPWGLLRISNILWFNAKKLDFPQISNQL